MYDILIISPNIDYYNNGEPFISPTGIERSVPIGLLSIAQYLTEKGLNVKLLHMPIMTPYKLSSIFNNYPSKLVLIQCHWFLYGAGAVKVAKAYKSKYPEANIFLGGYHSVYYAKEILANAKYIDGIIIGEGEKVSLNIYRKLRDKKSLKDVTSIIYREGEHIIENRPRKSDLLNINEIPIIDPHNNAFSEIRLRDINSIDAISLDRGRCPYKCNFCVSNTGYYRRLNTTLPIETVINQLKIYEKCGIKKLQIGELSFLHKDYFHKLCKRIIDEKINMGFEIETHPLFFNDNDFVNLLIKANIRVFSLGVESLIPDIIRRLNKPISKKETFHAIKKIKSAGGIARTSWMVNIPGSTINDHLRTMELIRDAIKNGAIATWINNLITLPGTVYYENPDVFNIRINARSFVDFCNFSLLAKQYVNKLIMINNPERYFTYLDKRLGYNNMIKVLFETRNFVANNVDVMYKSVISSDIPDFQRNELIAHLIDYQSKLKNVFLL